MPSAVIVRATLPAGLERMRRRHVASAAVDVPAHTTLLYPFVELADLDPAVRQRLREVVASHPAFDYRLARRAEWPDAIYVAVEPAEPFRRLHGDLQAAFPDWPLYGPDWNLEYEPHITVADREGRRDAGVLDDPAWGALPRPARAESIDVIATRPDGRWRLVWRIPLGDRPADRIRA